MRIYLALAWKELHELRWFWYAGMALMVVLPLTAELYEVFGFAGRARLLVNVTLALGAAFAVFTAVAATCRDLGAGVETFWRSRPISVATYVGVKFASGLLIVLSVAVAAIVFQHLLTMALTFGPGRGDQTWAEPLNAMAVQAPVMTAMYAVAFLLGAAIGQAVPAVFLALLAGLMLYFVPVLLPPLAYMDVFEALRHHGRRPQLSPQLGELAGTLLAIAGVAAVLAWLALERQVRIAVNAHVLGWTVAVLLLVMMSVAAMQIGSNLTPERVVPVTAERNEVVLEMITDGQRGIVATVGAGQINTQSRRELPDHAHVRVDIRGRILRSIDMNAKPAASEGVGIDRGWHRRTIPLFWTPSRPQRVTVPLVFSMTEYPEAEIVFPDGLPVGHRLLGLGAFDLIRESSDALVRATSFQRLFDTPYVFNVDVFQRDNRAMVFTPGYFPHNEDGTHHPARLMELAINPDHDLTSLRSLEWPARELSQRRSSIWRALLNDEGAFQLLDVPEWDMAERLWLTLKVAGWDMPTITFDEHHLLRFTHGQGVEVLRYSPVARRDINDQTGANGDMVRFERVGHRPPTPLERITGGHPLASLVHDDLLFVIVHEPQPGMIVFDLREPEQPRKLGHYAAPGELFMSLVATPDGKVILAGRDLHIFDPADW
ncbi:hypothetical protein ACERK3_17215 [Phycisphaerales bacterium AB-hyl4]|uniref:ABC transporter permease n=1 Tax=Natronomicrosphaera hydrolytica TaxID=3242702 RepID=A0ABV4U8T6_9BACT